MIGRIAVEGLEIECIIGIHPHERKKPQRIVVDLEIDRDVAAAAHGDDMSQTVDYVDLADAVTELAVERRFQLLETLADQATTLLLDRFNAERVRVKVMKPAAVPAASWAAVTLEKTR